MGTAADAHNCSIHGQSSNASDLLQGSGVETIGQTFPQGWGPEDSSVTAVESFTVFVRGHELVELLSHVLRFGSTHTEFAEQLKRAIRIVRVLFKRPTRRLRIPKRNDDKCEANWYLDEVGYAPSNVVGRFVEGHAIASPEGNQRAELVSKLRDCSHKASAKGLRRALGDYSN